MDVRLPDGTVIQGVPDGTTREQLSAKLQANGYNLDQPAQQQQQVHPVLDAVTKLLNLANPAATVASLATPQGRQDLANSVAGGARGAGSIGATIVAPYDMAQDAAAGKGLSLDSNRQRRADMDATLRDMGADTNSLPFQASKMATEVGGTMGVGGAVANGIERVAPALAAKIPGLVEAIRTAGMSTGTNAAPGFVPQAANLATRAVGGAINGGLTGGLIDPNQAVTGATINGSIPLISKVAGTAGQTVGSAFSNAMANNSALRKIATTLGMDVPQTVADIQTYYPKGAEDIPVSAAAATGNPKLAQLEQGSRLRNAPAWSEFDQKQGRAIFDNFNQATQEAGDLGDRLAQRQQNWQDAWAKASESQKPRIWQQRMTQFGADMEQALQSPASSNPQVRAVLDAINAEMDRVGPNFSPGNLQQLRANLNGKVQPLSPDAFKSAPRDNPAIRDLMSEMDDILNVSTGGKWQKVLEGYAKDSDAVRASKAASLVRGSYVDPATGRVRGVSLDANGEIPKITEAGLGGAMDAARLPDKTLALSPDANNRLTATLDAIRRQNVVQKLKRSATAGGGSDSVPNAIAGELVDKVPVPNMLLQMLQAVRSVGAGKTDTQLARLLSNPDELASALQRWTGPTAPNRLAVTLSRSAPAIAADR